MKAEELRIGNLVIAETAQSQPYITDVIAIERNRIIVSIQKENGIVFRKSPIELDDDIILKLGFQKKHKIYNYFELNEWITLTKANANEQEQGYDVRFKNTYVCRVNKVHVLQNICYYLNNFEELTIKTK